MWRHIFIAVMFALLAGTTLGQTSVNVTLYIIGVLDNQNNAVKTIARWKPTFETYINDQAARVGIPFRTKVVSLPFDDMTVSMANKSIDFAFTNTGQAATLMKLYGAKAVAGMENMRLGKALSLFGGAVFTHINNTRITHVRDCASPRTIAAVSLSSFGGYVMQLKEMHDQGVDVNSLVNTKANPVWFANAQEDVLSAINQNKADCGFVRSDTFEGAAAKNITQNLKLVDGKSGFAYAFFPFLTSTPLYAEWAVIRQPWTSHEDANTIYSILSSLRSTDPAALAGQYSRWFPPSDFTDVVEALYDSGQLQRDTVPISPSTVPQIVGAVVGSVAFVALLVLGRRGVAVWKKKKQLQYAPTRGDQVCALFISLKNDEKLHRHQTPETMGVVVEHFRSAVAHACEAHKCYMVKTVGSAILVTSTSRTALCKLSILLRQELHHKIQWSSIVQEGLAPTEIIAHDSKSSFHRRRRGTLSTPHQGDSQKSPVTKTPMAKTPSVRGEASSFDQRTSASQVSEEDSPCTRNRPQEPKFTTVEFGFGLHVGAVKIRFDEESMAYDYSGPAVEGAATASDVAQGEQILLTHAVKAGLTHDTFDCPTEHPLFVDFTKRRIGGKEMSLTQLNPPSEMVREFEQPHFDDDDETQGGGGIMAALEQASTGTTSKKIVVLCCTFGSLEARQSFAREEVAEQVAKTAKFIDTQLRELKGHRTSFVGNRLIATFNTFTPASNAMHRAITAAQRLKDFDDDNTPDTPNATTESQAFVGTALSRSLNIDDNPTFSCGIASGQAVVGYSGSDKVPTILGSVCDDACRLESLCRRYRAPYLTSPPNEDNDCWCLITGAVVASEVMNYAIVEHVGSYRPKHSAKSWPLSRFHAFKPEDGGDEWMYELEDGLKGKNDPFKATNALFEIILTMGQSIGQSTCAASDGKSVSALFEEIDDKECASHASYQVLQHALSHDDELLKCGNRAGGSSRQNSSAMMASVGADERDGDLLKLMTLCRAE